MTPQDDPLEAYFNSKADQAERSRLKKEIADAGNEEDLLMVELGNAIKTEDEIALLKKRIGKLRKSGTRQLYWAVAASVMLILVALWTFLPLNSTEERLFIQYYAPYDGLINARGAEKDWSQGLTFYEQQSYEKALEIFTAPGSSGELPEVKLLIANCYLNMENPKMAISYLNQIAVEERSRVGQNKDWYLALAYLMIAELERSKALLERLRNEDLYASEAAALLREDVYAQTEIQ